MNHAERVKELARKVTCQYAEGFPIAETESELHAAIDAMQYALDDAERERSTWIGRWLSVACEGDELRAKLAARDAEVGRLREDTRALILECQAAFAEELAAWDLDPPLHHVKQAHDKCTAWLDAALSKEVKGGE